MSSFCSPLCALKSTPTPNILDYTHAFLYVISLVVAVHFLILWGLRAKTVLLRNLPFAFRLTEEEYARLWKSQSLTSQAVNKVE